MRVNNHQNIILLGILVLFIIPISGISIDIYVPSLPAISQFFGVDKTLTQLTITTYLVGLGLMQLFAGCISDSFGRKKPFIIAMLCYLVITMLIPWSRTIYELLILRFFQGATVAVTIVPMRSVILDLFEGRELNKMMNYMTTAWSIGPIVAPAIGGYLQYYFGWQASFYFLVIYSTIVFILILLFVPETSQYRHDFNLKSILIRYRDILFHTKYSIGLLINCLLYSLIIMFSVVGPFLIQSVLHYSPIQFGYIALLMGLAWALGTLTNRFLIDIPLYVKVKYCLWCMFFVIVVMLTISISLPLNIYNIVIPIFIVLWLGGIIFPNYFTRSLAIFYKSTGSANALFGAILFFAGGINSAIATSLRSSSEVPLAIAYFILISFCLIIFYLEMRSVRSH